MTLRSSQTSDGGWPAPWFAAAAGWRHFFRPDFVLPTKRQKFLTAAIHFGIGLAVVGYEKLRNLFQPQTRTPPQNILFIGRYHLGDVLMTLPSMALARKELPEARMSLVVQERYRPHLDFSEIDFESIPEIEGLGFRAEVRAWRDRLRQERYDAVVFHRLTRPDFPAVVAAFLENIPHRVGGAEKGLQAFFTDLYRPSDRELVINYHWNLIQAWLRLPPSQVELRWPRVVRRFSETKSHDLLIAPFAQHTKEWPAESWHALLQYARAQSLRVALSASPGQSLRAAELIAAFPEVENLSTRSATMEDLFRDVQESSCVIALDTGIRHVAAALAVPCVVLGHGREHFRLFGAYVPTERYLVHLVPCAPCGAEPCPLGHLRCIREISVSSVLEAWQSLTPTT